MGIGYACAYPMNPWVIVNEITFLVTFGHFTVSAYPSESNENRCAYPFIFLRKANKEKVFFFLKF